MTISNEHHNVIVIGAGVAGIYQIKRLTDMGVDALVLDANDDLGGTWYRNRYPGCRFDSESYSYSYSFSQEVLDEWHWKELFSSQPENLRYLNFVADKFDLRKHMRFGMRVERMEWNEKSNQWHLFLDNGDTYTANLVITCMGVLSKPVMPKIEGMEVFKGESFHTYYWPAEGISLEGKKVGVIGTGATGIQVIQTIADEVSELKVFQRRPNWASPLNNREISLEEMDEIRSRYDKIFDDCNKTIGGFIHQPDLRGFHNVPPAERRALWDKLYDTPGFALLMGNFPEIFVLEEASLELSDYVADRIRQRVNDTDVAEKLIPKDHGYGIQRVPLETNYYETYNRENVELVDVKETPIERITATGIQTADGHYDLDVIIYATGFEAITGSFNQIEMKGVDGQSLQEKWKETPKTYLGLMTAGFPNMIMVGGPQSASGSTNFPRAIEFGVDWVTRLIEHMQTKGIDRIEPHAAAEEQWHATVAKVQSKLLLRNAKTWFTGYLSNAKAGENGATEGAKRYLAFFGGGPKYASILKQAEDDGYAGFVFGATQDA